MVGEIYLAEIYFTDLSESKIRPVLVIKELDKEDVICLQFSTKFKEDRIIVSNNDLIEGKLKKDSLVVVPKNFTLNKQLLIKKLGKLKDNKFKEIFDKFCEKIGCIK